MLVTGSARCVVQFLDDTLESVDEMNFPNGTYLSELIILPRVGRNDRGTYVCMAINHRGYAWRVAVVDVMLADHAEGFLGDDDKADDEAQMI